MTKKIIYDRKSVNNRINKITSKNGHLITLDDFSSLGAYLTECNYISNSINNILESIKSDLKIYNRHNNVIITITVYNDKLLEQAKLTCEYLKILFKHIYIKTVVLLNDKPSDNYEDELILKYNKDNIDISIFTNPKIYNHRDYVYKDYFSESDNLIVTDYIGTNSILEIPLIIDNKYVHGFDFTILENKFLLNVIIPSHIKDVFWNNSLKSSRIKELIFDNNVSIPLLYLESSNTLEYLVLPDNEKIIPAKSLRNNKSLKYLQLPSSLEEIGYDSLEYLNNIEFLLLPESVKIIKSGGLPRLSNKFNSLVIRSKHITISKSVINSLSGVDIYISKDSTISIYNDVQMAVEQTLISTELSKSIYLNDNKVLFKLPQSTLIKDGITYLLFPDSTGTIISVDKTYKANNIKLPLKIVNNLIDDIHPKVLRSG